MAKILVTGCNGALGYSFLDKKFLSKNKHRFYYHYGRDDIDLSNFRDTYRYISEIKPDYIIHCASMSGGIRHTSTQHSKLLVENCEINFNILQISHLLKVKKIVVFLTSGMYSPDLKNPNENQINFFEPPNNNYGASFAKRLLKPLIKSFRNEKKLDVIGLALSGIYGPGDRFDLETSAMLPATIVKALDVKFGKLKNLKVFGDGSQKRDYTFSYDLRDIIMWFIKNYSSSKVVNVTNGKYLSIRKYVDIIRKKTSIAKDKIIFDKKNIGEKKSNRMNSNFFKKLNKFNFTNLDKGLDITINWYLQNQRKNISPKKKISKKLIKILHNDFEEMFEKKLSNKLNNKKILILGGNSFLANYIQGYFYFSNQFKNYKIKVDSISKSEPDDCLRLYLENKYFKYNKINLLKINDVFKTFPKKYDYIYFLANYGQPELWMKNQKDLMKLNSEILIKFLEKAKIDNSKIVFFSSGDVYGSLKKKINIVNEDDDITLNLNHPRGSYAECKRFAEILIKNSLPKNQYTIVRPGHTYGPGMKSNDKRVIVSFINQFLKKNKIIMQDNGLAVKTFGYISDIAKMIINCAVFGKQNTYNTVGKSFSSIKNLALKICKDKSKIFIKINKGKKHIGSDYQIIRINNKKYCNEFKKFRFITLDKGVDRLIEWIKQN